MSGKLTVSDFVPLVGPGTKNGLKLNLGHVTFNIKSSKLTKKFELIWQDVKVWLSC